MAARVSEQGQSEEGGCRRCLVGSGETRGDPWQLAQSLRSPAFSSIKCKGLNKIHATMLVSSQRKPCSF